MSPFDRANMTSYSSFVESMCLRCTVFHRYHSELFVETGKLSIYSTCIWRLMWDDAIKISGGRLLPENYEFPGLHTF